MKKGFMKAVYLFCPICHHNWHQKVNETKIINAPCRCGLKVDMEGTEGRYGAEFIDTLLTITKPLGSFTRYVSKIKRIDMKII